jgi:hypothetical protein
MAISLENGEIVLDEDMYATVKLPKGVGRRNEIKPHHVKRALGISRKEWGEIVVLSKSLSMTFRDTLSDSRRLTSASSTLKPG